MDVFSKACRAAAAAFVPCLLLLYSGSVRAEQSPPTAAPKTADTSQAERKVGFVVFPFAFYTPDTLLGGGLSTVIFRRANENEERRRNDALTAVGLYTMRHQFTFALIGNKYFEDGRFLLAPRIAFSRFPSDFYGIGNDSPASAEETYTPLVLRATVAFSVNPIEQLFVGLVAAGGFLKLTKWQADGLVADLLEHEPSSGVTTGLGVRLERDSRNDNLYPTKGSIATFTALFYRDAFGGDFEYDEFEIDARTYLPFVLRSVVALQVYGIALVGAPPFDYLPQIGGQYLLRGLELGRYRDRVYTAIQAEWRIPLFWRFGAVAFAGIGNVYPSLRQVRLDEFKATGGLGLRVALKRKEHIHFRFDVGFAEDGPKFYLNLLEAF